MPNVGRFGKDREHYSICGDVSGLLLPPLNQYCIPSGIPVNVQNLLGILGNGTKCYWDEEIQITTPLSEKEIAKKLGIPESCIYTGNKGNKKNA